MNSYLKTGIKFIAVSLPCIIFGSFLSTPIINKIFSVPLIKESSENIGALAFTLGIFGMGLVIIGFASLFPALIYGTSGIIVVIGKLLTKNNTEQGTTPDDCDC